MDINPADLRISTYPDRPTGGMHTNGPNPGIRIVHIPTGTEATCVTERSRHKNLGKAMAILVANLG